MMRERSKVSKGVHPPTNLYEYQKKGVVKFDCCNRLKTKEDVGRGDGFQNGNEWSAERQLGC
jgi:hypothetical protein